MIDSSKLSATLAKNVASLAKFSTDVTLALHRIHRIDAPTFNTRFLRLQHADWNMEISRPVANWIFTNSYDLATFNAQSLSVRVTIAHILGMLDPITLDPRD